MPVELKVTANYEKSVESLFEKASNFADLIGATSKISKYKGLPAVPMEAGSVYNTDIKIFGIVTCKNYQIRVDKVDPYHFFLETSESNEVVKLWRHTLQILPTTNGAIWIDHVIIDAGKKTPFVARYARFMYKHRHYQRSGTNVQSCLQNPSRLIAFDRPTFNPVK